MIGTDYFVQVAYIHTGVISSTFMGEHSYFCLFPGKQNGDTLLAVWKGALEEMPEL